jgi:hypothetical protein
MSQRSTFHPPRLLPDRPFPPYAYVPGDTPHPTRDPGGHSYGAEFETPEPPGPEDWRACRDYLYGIDLFNHGFYGRRMKPGRGSGSRAAAVVPPRLTCRRLSLLPLPDSKRDQGVLAV